MGMHDAHGFLRRRRRALSWVWAFSSHIRAGFRDLADDLRSPTSLSISASVTAFVSNSLHHASGYIYPATQQSSSSSSSASAHRPWQGCTPPAPHNSPAPLPFAVEASLPCRSRCLDIRRRATLLQVTLRQATLRNNPRTTNKALPSWARLPRTSNARPSAAADSSKAAWRRFVVAAWWTNAAVTPQSSLTKLRAFLDRSAGLEAGVAVAVRLGLGLGKYVHDRLSDRWYWYHRISSHDNLSATAIVGNLSCESFKFMFCDSDVIIQSCGLPALFCISAFTRVN